MLGHAAVASRANSQIIPGGYFPRTLSGETRKVSRDEVSTSSLERLLPSLIYLTIWKIFLAVQPTFFCFLISYHYLWLWPQLIKVLQRMLEFKHALKLH